MIWKWLSVSTFVSLNLISCEWLTFSLPTSSDHSQANRETGLVVKGTSDKPQPCLGDPRIKAMWFTFSMAQLMPSPDVIDLNVIDLNPGVQRALAYGHKLVLKFVVAEDSATDPETWYSTPKWLFDSGVPSVSAPGSTIWPVYSNPLFVYHYTRLVQALADRYDGDPNVMFFRMNGFNNATEMRLFVYHPPGGGQVDQTVNIKNQWRSYGYGDIENPSKGVRYPGGQFHLDQLAMVDIWFSAFHMTPLSLTIQFPNEVEIPNSEKDWEELMHAAIQEDVLNIAIEQKRGLIFTNNGLHVSGAQGDSTLGHKKFSEFYERGLKENLPIQTAWTSITESDPETQPIAFAQQATGIEADLDNPLSHVSYSVVGDNLFCEGFTLNGVDTLDIELGFDWFAQFLIP